MERMKSRSKTSAIFESLDEDINNLTQNKGQTNQDHIQILT